MGRQTWDGIRTDAKELEIKEGRSNSVNFTLGLVAPYYW
jgi:hypothetical protein